ncbi:transcription factor SPT20 homolog isoform X1 [Biomphalaria glabrata]|uniref:Transcription factor SPT20 homolog isoform X1 n=1 Tax=Biomphalaria glabrata TaxID=6526 RepID=A0A2C9JM25_BIOGL|nr:transcription factor SPT20 homolog isoform X1 [Biomphalaria glabrata]
MDKNNVASYAMALANLPDIERAMEYAEYVLACSDQSPSTFLKSSLGSTSKSKSIHQKLLDLFIEETMKEPDNKDLVYASHLLAKLTKRERLNCMVLSLYPGNEGYSIMLRSKSGVESETMKLPYEESEILEFVDAAQLPPFLLDLLEKAQMNVFYSGCVIVEIRDYRRSATGSHDTQYVLLRPSPQSLLRDITVMSCDGHTWTQDDLFHLESELILATEEPLCLDPSPAVMFVENALQFEEKLFNDPALKRCIKPCTQSAVNRKRKLAQAPAPKGMQLYDFITKRKEKNKNAASNAQSKKLAIDGFKHKPQLQLAAPESIDVKKFVKLSNPPTSDGMIFVEEHTMERDPTLERHMMAKITIYQPQLGDNYIGEFYLDHDYTQGRTGEEGRKCRFVIGSRQCVDRYLQQFKDLFTEEGKLQVKIAILKANETAPTIHYTQMITPTQTIPNLTPTAITINNAQTLIKQVAAANPHLVKAADMGTVASLAAKRNIPIQLSLSLSPACSLSTTPGSIFAQANAAGIPSSLSAQFIASTVPSGSTNLTAQRIKGPVTIGSQQRPNSSPLASPATTPKVSTPQQPLLPTSASIMAIPKVPTPTPAQTPPPNARTPTPTLSGARRSSATEQQSTSIGQQQQVQQQNLANFLQGLASANSQGNSDGQQPQSQQQPSGITNISIGNLSNLPPNINIQGLTGIPGVNITSLPGLQQVSVAQIAVPITMINNNPSILQTQSALLGTSSTTTGTNTATFVTMVTAFQGSTSNTSTTTSMSMSSQIPSSSGSGVLTFPVGLTQLMPITSKTQGQGIRSSTMPVLQLQNQQIQLVSVQQQRGPVKSGTLTTTSAQQVTRLAQGATSTVPLSTVLTGPQMTALAVGGKPGQTGGTTITAQQLIQLTSGGSASLGQGATHVAFQKGQTGGHKTLQFHSLQLKPTGATTIAQAQGVAKSKSKKRTTPTPPK